MPGVVFPCEKCGKWSMGTHDCTIEQHPYFLDGTELIGSTWREKDTDRTAEIYDFNKEKNTYALKIDGSPQHIIDYFPEEELLKDWERIDDE